ncbi:Fic family protein [Paenibacillus borealis]|uniref:Filamentation induced by cAMP protein fic n=1 Tax=Paenibacillus borealis TaxID=160799 RepID=A0A089MI03_PAEBO|nr:Fic family protein [Paenibacillus borealis]AIQ56219.1 filamentation induced by cAMP protein fic [Paenibacillus borealis]
MGYPELLRKKDLYEKAKDTLPEITVKSYVQAFELEYTHNSTAIEGNTLTLLETKVVLEEGLSVGGKMREIYEVINHNKAYQYVKACIDQKKPLDEGIIKDIHAVLTENIMVGEMYRQVKDFYADLAEKDVTDVIELAAWTHGEFVPIHPFADGNGRTSRLIMNYQLLAHGYLPVSIAKESRLDYFNALEAYAVNRDLKPFADMIASLEEQQLDRYLGMIERQGQRKQQSE